LNPAANPERLLPMYEVLGKLLFPRLPPDLQRRKINILLAVLLVGLLLGGLMALMILSNNKVGAR
jgi:hypothetical protein